MSAKITVVMATWNRGRHILPSVRSILSQTMPDFELLVIGDAATDDTEKHLASIEDPRLRWINNPERWGTQSGPNNRGLKEARAPIIAYCGHDDVWSPDHLACLLKKYVENPDLGAVCSGLVIYTGDPKFPYKVRGLFEDFSPFTSRIFTAPSAFSHRLNVDEMPRWKRRRETELPVDYAFQASLGEGGCKFGSTGRVTAHKWATTSRYLSYFVATSTEQETMLGKFKAKNFELEVERIIKVAKETDRFMSEMNMNDMSGEERIRTNDQRRGIDLPPILNLETGVVLSQDSGPRGRDWRPMREEDNGYRWCGPRVNPKFLLNVVHNGRVEIAIDVVATAKRGFPDVSVLLNSEPVTYELEWKHRVEGHMFGRLRMKGALRPDRASVIGFLLPDDTFLGEGPQRKLGFAIGNVSVTPEPLSAQS